MVCVWLVKVQLRDCEEASLPREIIQFGDCKKNFPFRYTFDQGVLVRDQPEIQINTSQNKRKGKVINLAGGGFDPPTFGLWAQHASSAPTRFDVRNCLSIAPYKAFRHKEESSHTPPQR
jgi:hypothetical protein